MPVLPTTVMNLSGHSTNSQAILHDAFAWLATPPPVSLAMDLGPLRHYLKEIAKAALPPIQRLKILDLFQSRIDVASRALKPQLIEARLPLQSPLRLIAQGLMDLHGIMARARLRSVQEIGAGQTVPAAVDTDGLCGAVLRNLAEQQQVALFVATLAPVGLWTQAQAAFRLANASPQTTHSVAAEQIFKRMLALAAVQPESLTAREIAILIDYLPEFAHALEIATDVQGSTDAWFWLEENRAAPPVAMARRLPPARGSMIYFTCVKLGQMVSEHLEQLARNESTAVSRLPAIAPVQECLEVLARVQSRWLSSPKRHSARHAGHFRVEVCAGLDRLWHLLRGTQPEDAGDATPSITQWMVLNESSSGYALMHVAGDIDGMVAGDILGVRLAPDRPWTICLLRWGRSDNAAHIEIGLELISPNARPVHVAQHATPASALTPSLLVASQAAADHGEALFVGRGQLVGNRFTLIAEDADCLQLTECEVQRLALQTARVEKFEFTRDFTAR
jgi:cyclic-di-GMP-binding protein